MFLRLVGQQLAKHTSQPNRFRAQIVSDQVLTGARSVAFVEDQVNNRLHR